MQKAGRMLLGGLIAGVIFTAILGLGFCLGRDYERVSALAAEPSMPAQVITKAEAWECVARARGWRPRMIREDLRPPHRQAVR